MNVPQELRDVLSWLSVLVPSCLKEWRNLDGNLGSKCFFLRRESMFMFHVSNLHCLSLFSGQQQDQGLDDKNRLSFPFPALAFLPEHC